MPSTMPTSSVTWSESRSRVNSQPYRMVAKATMSALCRPTLSRPSVSARAAEPRKKTSAVCTRRYRASKPSTAGVRIRLPTRVWNTRVATPWEAPTSTIVATDSTRIATIVGNPAWVIGTGIAQVRMPTAQAMAAIRASTVTAPS